MYKYPTPSICKPFSPENHVTNHPPSHGYKQKYHVRISREKTRGQFFLLRKDLDLRCATYNQMNYASEIGARQCQVPEVNRKGFIELPSKIWGSKNVN